MHPLYGQISGCGGSVIEVLDAILREFSGYLWQLPSSQNPFQARNFKK